MKKLFLVLAFLASLNSYSQNDGIVKGNIIDLEANSEPLLFANVILKGTDLKTRTNFNGNFEIAGVIPGKYTLEISFLGYETLKTPIEVAENKVTEIQTGLSAKSISIDPITLANLETTSDDNALAGLEGSTED